MTPTQFQNCIDFEQTRNEQYHPKFTITEDLKKVDTAKIDAAFVGDLAQFRKGISKAIAVVPVSPPIP